MALVRSFNMPFETNHFNENQRVWVVYMSGSFAAECTGQFRGSGRWVKAWVNWDSASKPHPDIQEFEVDDEFAKRHNILDYS